MNVLETIVGVFEIAGNLLLSPVLRKRYNRWGASEEEVRFSMPGDDLVPGSLMGYTHAITIEAKPRHVWPWLVQLGQGRGGMYSYTGLENLIGCKIRNVDAVVPELQNPAIGELVRLGPEGYPCFSIMRIQPGQAFILLSADPKSGIPVGYNPKPGKGYSIATWQFALKPLQGGKTRLLTRQRLSFSPDMAWVWRLTEPVGFVMERKMLREIKRRAEKLARP